MDGFFQNKTSRPRNDLPVLEKTARGWEETTGHNCDAFITAQDLAISRAAANGGYWLDSEGNLRIIHIGEFIELDSPPAFYIRNELLVGFFGCLDATGFLGF